jgi:hypothetical protein
VVERDSEYKILLRHRQDLVDRKSMHEFVFLLLVRSQDHNRTLTIPRIQLQRLALLPRHRGNPQTHTPDLPMPRKQMLRNYLRAYIERVEHQLPAGLLSPYFNLLVG